LEELGAKFGDEVALDFEHALKVGAATHPARGQDLKPHDIETENVEFGQESK
jgi:hypothetical protein